MALNGLLLGQSQASLENSIFIGFHQFPKVAQCGRASRITSTDLGGCVRRRANPVLARIMHNPGFSQGQFYLLPDVDTSLVLEVSLLTSPGG